MIAQLFQNRRILDLLVAGQQEHLGDQFRRAWVVIGERKEQSTAVLCVRGKDAQSAARHAVHLHDLLRDDAQNRAQRR